jgi:intracellular septation protein
MIGKNTVKFISEILPVAAFFVTYKFYGIIEATVAIVILSLLGLIIIYFSNHKASPMHLFTVAIISVFGGLTIVSNNTAFIKMKPTIINLLFAAILGFGLMKKKLFLKKLLGEKIELTQNNWSNLSKKFILFFVSLAITNEVVWRNFAEETWIYFKTFGILPITILFVLSQARFILRNKS